MGGVGHEIPPDHIEVVELGDVPCHHEPLALAFPEGADAQRQHDGPVVLRSELDGAVVLAGVYVLVELGVADHLGQQPAIVPRPLNVHEERSGGIGPLDALALIKDHQSVRHRDRGFPKASNEPDLPLAPFAAALLILGDGAEDLAPESPREWRGQTMLAPDQGHQAKQVIEVSRQEGPEGKGPDEGPPDADPGESGRGPGRAQNEIDLEASCLTHR